MMVLSESQDRLELYIKEEGLMELFVGSVVIVMLTLHYFYEYGINPSFFNSSMWFCMYSFTTYNCYKVTNYKYSITCYIRQLKGYKCNINNYINTKWS